MGIISNTMKYRYLNRGGNSNVASYIIGADNITVQFNDGSVYLYDYASTSITRVEHMKSLASKGVGLNSYIGRVVRKNYAKKLR